LLISVDDAVARLSKGGIVALPSETVYGLAGLALDSNSVQEIYTLKGRPATNPLIIHVSSVKAAEKLSYFSQEAHTFAQNFWPGPLTLILPKKECVPDLVTAGNPTVALRIPQHPVFLEILKRLDHPLAAPSANPSNRTSPTEAKHLMELFGEKCPPTVDGGKCSIGIESTVLDLSREPPTILRPGAITRKLMKEKNGSGCRYPAGRNCQPCREVHPRKHGIPRYANGSLCPTNPTFFVLFDRKFPEEKLLQIW
jgi:L-threonylcarbamoyladenylate synthase